MSVGSCVWSRHPITRCLLLAGALQYTSSSSWSALTSRGGSASPWPNAPRKKRKQRVIGWRDQTQLPTDINYHRDHLGIIQNNFGAAMRLGEGDEVRDVPHPLSPAGPDIYDFALGDTTTIMLPEREVRVVTLRVRPKDFGLPRIVGTLYLDAETADLVRMAFNFTPRSYL